MFTSKDELKLSYGIDMEIGKFFVDRKIPSDNLYWKNRFLYITPMPGYLFIPLYTDLQFRLGLPRHELLTDRYASFMERIMHSIAKQEFSGLTMEQHINECVEITKEVSKNDLLLKELIAYFSGDRIQGGISFGTSLRALNRVDSYLFTLCYFNFDNELKKKLIDAWHACMTFYLIADDLDDIQKDFEENEDNTILEAGLNENGARLVESFMQESYDVMNGLNPVFANRMDYSWQQIDVFQTIRDYLAKSGRSVD